MARKKGTWRKKTSPGRFLKESARQFWHVVWEEDTVLSWLLNIALAFILMKFVIYPGLGLVLSTSHPVVAVVSGSMEHDGVPFDQWYDSQKDFYMSYGISSEGFFGFPLRDGIDTGDIIVLKGKPPEDLRVGDVIVFNKGGPEPIIHRVVRKWESGEETYFETKGDHNPGVSELDRNINGEQVLGRAAVRIPYLGYVKILFTRWLACLVTPSNPLCARSS